MKIKYRGKKMYFCNMVENYIEQFASLLTGRTDEIIFPSIEDFLGEENNEI
jgi:hypothetical protein